MKSKKFMLATTIVTLLPVLVGLLLWEKLPEQLPTHFSLRGNADGFSSKGFAVFGIPLMMLAFQWICYGCTLLDKQNRGHNRKVLDLVGLIFPGMSVFFGVLIYAHGMGLELDLSRFLFPLLGLMFILIGNWLPKIKQNTTLGIKIKWTLYSEENWNKTHRFASFVWVIGGVLFCILGFVPGKALVWLLPLQIILLAVVPMVYSWQLAKKQQAAGTYTESEVSRRLNRHPALKVISLVLVAVLLAGVAFLMFIGDITYSCTDTALVIEADYWEDSTVPYDRIDSIEYRDTAPEGSREWGFGSARLLMGWFDNDELGDHTRYSYAGTDAYILLTCGEDVVVLNADSEEETRALYEELRAKLGEVSP